MLLEILEKIEKKTFDFTPEEIPHVVSYLPHLVENTPADKLRPIVEQGDPIALAHALTSMSKEMVKLLESCDEGTGRQILTADDFYLFRSCCNSTFNNDGNQYHSATARNLESFDRFMAFAQKKLGNDFAAELLRLNNWQATTPAWQFPGYVEPMLELVKKTGAAALVEEMLTANDSQAFRHITTSDKGHSHFENLLRSITGFYLYDHRFYSDSKQVTHQQLAPFLPLLKNLLGASDGEAFQNICRNRGPSILNMLEQMEDPKFTKQLLESGGYRTLENVLQYIRSHKEGRSDDFYETRSLPEFLERVRSYCGQQTLDKMLLADNFSAFKTAIYISGYDEEERHYRATQEEDTECNPAINQLLQIANASEDKTLAGRMCVAHHDIIEALWDRGKHKAVRAILDLLDEENARLLVAAMPGRWQEIFGDKAPKAEDLTNRKTVRLLTSPDNGPHQWRTKLNMEPPDDWLKDLPTYGFKTKLYDEMLPLMRTQEEMNNVCSAGGAPVWAYKIAVLFANRAEAGRYLDTFAQRADWNHDGNPNYFVHDALLFDIPETGQWDIPKWKNLVMRFGPAASKFLGLAPKIEAYIAEHNKQFPAKPDEILELAAQVSYERSAEKPVFAKQAVSYGLSERNFNECLDILKTPKAEEHLPQLVIDGAEIGHPNFYMELLSPTDPTGLILGKITNCCQSIGGAGDECARHGMTSSNGGFYVWRHKTDGKQTPDDDIVAQSWGWIGKDNSLVFDSFERLGPAYDAFAKPFLEQFAHKVTGKHTFSDGGQEAVITAVKLGTGGKTPKEGFVETTASTPKDYGGNSYRDSEKQYSVPPVNHKSQTPSHTANVARRRGGQAVQHGA